MAERRAYPEAVSLDTGKILVVGGSRDQSPLRTAELFDPQSATWMKTGSMSVARTDFALVMLGVAEYYLIEMGKLLF